MQEHVFRPTSVVDFLKLTLPPVDIRMRCLIQWLSDANAFFEDFLAFILCKTSEDLYTWNSNVLSQTHAGLWS